MHKTLCTASVKDVCQETRSYVVQTPAGSILRRNRRHILDATVMCQANDPALEGSVEFPVNLQKPDNPPQRDDVIPPSNTGMQNTPTPPAGSLTIECQLHENTPDLVIKLKLQ